VYKVTAADLAVKQNVDLSAFKQSARVHLVDNAIRHALLTDLPVVDLLLHCVVGDKSVDVARPRLAVAVDATHGLAVMTWVPRRIEHHHTTSADQVDTQTAGTIHTDTTHSSVHTHHHTTSADQVDTQTPPHH